jgi:hypothetical protein
MALRRVIPEIAAGIDVACILDRGVDLAIPGSRLRSRSAGHITGVLLQTDDPGNIVAASQVDKEFVSVTRLVRVRTQIKDPLLTRAIPPETGITNSCGRIFIDRA